jgi:hypothetical protein
MLHCMCGTQGLPRHPLLAILVFKKNNLEINKKILNGI